MNNKVHKIARILFGAGFVIFGLNGLFQFMPSPPISAEAGALLGALAATGYFYPMVKIIELITGALILSNNFAPLATMLITPVLLGITTIHLFLNPTGLPMMVAIHTLHGIVAYGYKEAYKHILVRKI